MTLRIADYCDNDSVTSCTQKQERNNDRMTYALLLGNQVRVTITSHVQRRHYFKIEYGVLPPGNLKTTHISDVITSSRCVFLYQHHHGYTHTKCDVTHVSPLHPSGCAITVKR